MNHKTTTPSSVVYDQLACAKVRVCYLLRLGGTSASTGGGMTVSAHTYFGHYNFLAFGLGELQIFCVEAHRQLRRRARLRVVFGNVSSYRPTN